MTVRFKSLSEYQKSYRVSRSRSVSPQRWAPLAGLRSDQMGVSREPGLQRRKRLGPAGPAQSCNFLLRPPDPHQSITQPTLHAHRTAPPAASRSRSAHRKEPSLDPKPPTPTPGSRAEPASPAEREPPAGPRPPAGSERAAEPRTAGKSTKPHPSKPDSQPQLSSPVTAAPDGRQPSANEVQHALRLRAGLRSGGQRSGSQRTEYNRQFSWKKPAAAASPVLTAEQVLYSSKSVPPFKTNPVSMETEYQKNFQGLVPLARPHLRKHLEHQRVPLFHTHMSNKKRREESEKMPRPDQVSPAPQRGNATPPPPQVHMGHRIPEEGGETDADAAQAKELRQKALLYRHRAWGTNFSRHHLSQLLSEHNALWEPTETTDSATDPPTPRLTCDLSHNPDSRSSSSVEALDLASRSSNCSKRSSVVASGDLQHPNKNTRTNAQTPPGPAAERILAWGGEEEEEENTDEDEGRLPTPRLKTRPVQRTHHDVTTPATGGAILVGKLKSSDESPFKPQRCGTAGSAAAAADTAVNLPVTRKEAWPDNNSTRLYTSGPAANHNPASSPPSKPIRTKQTPSPGAPPPLVPPPQHCIQGTLRHPDFQHNGELGLRFRELQCSGGGCGSDEDDRLSVMSWRSAASCSVASAVLERAQKRRDNFWGKR